MLFLRPQVRTVGIFESFLCVPLASPPDPRPPSHCQSLPRPINPVSGVLLMLPPLCSPGAALHFLSCKQLPDDEAVALASGLFPYQSIMYASAA